MAVVMKHNEPKGLFAFRNMTRGAIGRTSITVRFTEEVSDIHMRQLYDAMHCWMIAQKMIAENGGQPPTREQISDHVDAIKRDSTS